MAKQLMVIFTGEGSTDRFFLGTIILRTLQKIALQHFSAFDVYRIEWLGPSKGDATLKVIRKAFDEGANLLIIHQDTDQYSVADTLLHHFQPLLNQTADDLLRQMPIVPLTIRHEQETWLFADLDALEEALDGKLDRPALHLPPDIEARANAKELFKQAIRHANRGQSRKRGFKEEIIVRQLAEKIRLSQLARLPSYQCFVVNLEAALRQIDYIR